MPKFLIVMRICGIFAILLLYCGALIGCPDVGPYLKTKTLKNVHLSSFFQLLQKFKCLGDVMDSVSLPQFTTLRSQLFNVFKI